MKAIITALGGSGENGRNCYLLQRNGKSVLLDCGVMRETTPEGIGRYPCLTAEIARSLDAVFLSHAHEDHCAALPLLYRLGYRGAVYASPETAQAAPGMMEKWIAYVQARGGSLPFDPSDAGLVRFSPMEMGKGTLVGEPVVTGRSGHTAGSLWLAMGPGELFYSGDICPQSHTLAYDAPPPCAAAIINCAYAGRALDQERQYAKLLHTARQALDRGVRLLLPVPAAGRGCDMLLFLAEHLPAQTVCAEKNIVDACLALAKKTAWIRAGAVRTGLLDRVRIIDSAAARSAAWERKDGVFFITDGMLTTAVSAGYLRAFAKSGRTLALLTGHAAAGTPAAALPLRRQQDEPASWPEGAVYADHLTIKVHFDDQDACAALAGLGAKTAVLFHADRSRCQTLIESLAAQGVDACTLAPGERLTIETDL
ncbi:MAG: MBL fold metallo-hydrolase [Clostridia bacterium]|nr:MBL fold metallo-hydrolase [Clostridia bacterium]